jgi:hypothetical protein
MKPNTIYSKSGKGVQEASGKTSLLKRGDRAVLSAIDGRATLAEVAKKVGKSFDAGFQALIDQLEGDGFVRAVSSGGSNTPHAPRAGASSGGGADLDFTTIMPIPRLPPKPADAAQRAKEQESALYKARQEAEARAQAERDRLKAEGEAKARAEAEAKFRADAERRIREEAEARVKAEAEAKARAAREAALRIAAEAKAKAEAAEAERARLEAERARLEVERRQREEAERKAREEAERARREAEELRQRLEEERKAREAEERRRREEEERRRKEEEERRRKEEEERRAREEAERKAREEAERKAREEEERVRRARAEEQERRAREEEERRVRAEAQRKAREEEERARRAREEEQERTRRAQGEEQERTRRALEEEIERARREAEQARAAAGPEPAPSAAAAAGPEPAPSAAVAAEPEPAPSAAVAAEPEPAPSSAATVVPGSLDTLMADLDSFSQRDDEDRKAREAAERKGRDEKARKLREEAERRAQEQAQAERREAEERRRKEEEERGRKHEEERRRKEEEQRRHKEEEQRRHKEEEQRRDQEEAERLVREAEEARRQEAEERKRKARESTAAAKQAQPAAPEDDIGITDEDLDMEEVRRDEAMVARDSRKAQRDREREERDLQRRARERERARAEAEPPLMPSKRRRPVKWGKPLAVTLFVLLLAAVGVLHVMPIPTEPYERAASEALGRQVRISSARLSLYSGVRLDLEGLRIGNTGTIAAARAYPELGSLLDERKSFTRIELDGATLAQQALGEAMFAKTKGANFSVGRIIVKQLKVQSGLALPTLEADVMVGPDGAVRSVTLRGPENLVGKLTPSGGNVEFDVTASSFALPVAPAISLNSFAMKGTATRQGVNVASWGGALLDGALNGVANLRWAGGWHVDGVVTVRNINAAVFAPALLSEGRAEGTAKFSMNAQDPAKLAGGSRMEGKFTVYKGVLGSFDLSRLIQTSGRQSAGRTQFAEMTGQGVYDRGAVALRDVHISAGALNAGASADIAQNGALSGRIVADVKTATQTLRQTVVLGGTVKEPQVRN